MEKQQDHQVSSMSKMVKVAEEAGVDMITDLLLNHIIAGVIPADWKLGTIVSCYKEKRNALEIENCRGLKLTDQILKIARRITEKKIRHQVEISSSLVTYQDLEIQIPFSS